jgi:hypothetical protein
MLMVVRENRQGRLVLDRMEHRDGSEARAAPAAAVHRASLHAP